MRPNRQCNRLVAQSRRNRKPRRIVSIFFTIVAHARNRLRIVDTRSDTPSGQRVHNYRALVGEAVIQDDRKAVMTTCQPPRWCGKHAYAFDTMEQLG